MNLLRSIRSAPAPSSVLTPNPFISATSSFLSIRSFSSILSNSLIRPSASSSITSSLLSPTSNPVSSSIFGQVRYATHMSEGRANGAKNGAGKRLGAKKGDGEYVVSGNILFRQRGTHWFAGENCMMGRDHTIHAASSGFVRYYRDPIRHPTRKYIGVVFENEGRLPRPITEPRSRRLGMITAEMENQQLNAVVAGDSEEQPQTTTPTSTPTPRHRRDYVSRDPNYLIGRLKNSPHALPLPDRKNKSQSISRMMMPTKKKGAKAKGPAKARK